jgi:hypothetical protein
MPWIAKLNQQDMKKAPNHDETQFSLQVLVVAPKLNRQMRWGIKGSFIQLDVPTVATGYSAETIRSSAYMSCLPLSIKGMNKVDCINETRWDGHCIRGHLDLFFLYSISNCVKGV